MAVYKAAHVTQHHAHIASSEDALCPADASCVAPSVTELHAQRLSAGFLDRGYASVV